LEPFWPIFGSLIGVNIRTLILTPIKEPETRLKRAQKATEADLLNTLLVDGFVSAASGQISFVQSDLHIKGAQDLILQRIYVAPQILGSYDDKQKRDRLLLGKALCQLYAKGWVVLPHLLAGYNSNSPYFQVRDPHGTTIEFQIVGNRGHLKTSGYGCSNLRGGEPLAEADIRNIGFLVEGRQVIVSWPNGTKRIYQPWFGGLYRLELELLPNRKAIRYSYETQGLARISSTDARGKYTYAAIDRVGDQHYRGSDGREAKLFYETRKVKGKAKGEHYKHKVKATFLFPVMTGVSNPYYSNSAGYNERTLLNFYDAKSYPISCTYWQQKGSPCRIQTFSTPSGSTSFTYDPPIAGQKGGSTTVTHPNHSQTIYRFSSQFLLSAIENWYEGKLYNQKLFFYDSKQHISKIETKDGQGDTLLTKTYECDQAGNPTSEKWEGDLGAFNIKRKFDKNRIVFEEYDDGLAFAFTYLGDTRLVTSKTTLGSGAKLRKTLYSYDDANNLVQVEEEDKTRTTYTLYQTAPHLHRVEWEEKRDWKSGLLHKIHYSYDQWGNTNREEHFGSNGNLAYTIQRNYNAKGELLSETNPLHETAVYEYDLRGRCSYEEPFSNGLVIRRSFDDKGHLTLLQEGTQETRFDYNASDELIKKVDYLGTITTYHPHPVHGKPDRIEEGSAITQINYNLFGYPIETTDATNAKTIRKYNSYGDVVQIIYPEAGEERFSYYPNGLLKSHTNADGLTTAYTYDALGRIREKTAAKRTTTFEYDGYNLLKMIDPAGFVTTYKYDLTDRKIEETRENRTTCYGYDPLGFLSWEEKGKHRTEYTNDALGRVLLKSIDGILKTSWTYDAGGNVSTIQQGGTAQFDYDPHNRLIEKVDAEGNKTVISYEKGPDLTPKN
jgi:YD repeat-containing protein